MSRLTETYILHAAKRATWYFNSGAFATAANSPLVPSFNMEYPSEDIEKLRMTMSGNCTCVGRREARRLGAATFRATDALLFMASLAVLLLRT
jgi:hypothetical protein